MEFVSDPQWVVAIATVALTIATLLLAIVAAFQDLIREAIRSPHLTVHFLQSPPLSRLSFWRGSGLKKHREAYVFHFDVRNEGTGRLVSLEAVVEEIWILHDSDRPEKVSDFYSTNLRYGGEGTRFIDLNPGRRIAWNIGHISAKAHQAWHEKAIFHDVTPAKKGHLRFLLDLVEYPNGQANCFPPGDYAIKIVFYSVNANRVEQWLKIQWTGQWRSSPVDMFDEIIITPIPALDEWLEKKAA